MAKRSAGEPEADVVETPAPTPSVPTSIPARSIDDHYDYSALLEIEGEGDTDGSDEP